MSAILFIDRQSGQKQVEKVYGGEAIRLLYGNWMFAPLKALVSRFSFCSAVYGWWQKQPWTKSKIQPFIEEYGVDASEFLEPVSAFNSFNDFFIRKLKPQARPVVFEANTAVIPADGRYYFYQNISHADGFMVKGKKFSLAELLGDNELAAEYELGSMVLARLCPSDYHRYHFPVEGIPVAAKLINGALYSVNPFAVKQNIEIFTENKRAVTLIESQKFGTVAYVEVGATNVGSINQTYVPGQKVHKGDEKGFFAFGGSALVLLFKKGTIQFDADLLEATASGFEIRCLMGQSMGKQENQTR